MSSVDAHVCIFLGTDPALLLEAAPELQRRTLYPGSLGIHARTPGYDTEAPNLSLPNRQCEPGLSDAAHWHSSSEESLQPLEQSAGAGQGMCLGSFHWLLWDEKELLYLQDEGQNRDESPGVLRQQGEGTDAVHTQGVETSCGHQSGEGKEERLLGKVSWEGSEPKNLQDWRFGPFTGLLFPLASPLEVPRDTLLPS